jgi:trk system potassium uptake protein TrkA
MKKNFAVVGLGRFGLGLVEALANLNADVIAIDTDEASVAAAGELITHAVVCDSTNEHSLREIGIQNVDHAIVAIGANIQATILTTVILKEMGVKYLTVRVDNDYYAPIIMKLGANDIVSPQKIAGIRLANRIVSDTFIDYYDITSDYGVVQLVVNDKFEPIAIQDINPRNKFDVNLILINRDSVTFAPKGIDEIHPNDHLFVVGKAIKVAKFDQYLNELVIKNSNEK